LAPTIGANTRLRREATELTRSAANRALIEAGSEMKTASAIRGSRTVKVPPKRRRESSMKGTGRAAKRASWSAAGSEGDGGSVMPRIYSANSGNGH
jgi:hypothetical protein